MLEPFKCSLLEACGKCSAHQYIATGVHGHLLRKWCTCSSRWVASEYHLNWGHLEFFRKFCWLKLDRIRRLVYLLHCILQARIIVILILSELVYLVFHSFIYLCYERQSLDGGWEDISIMKSFWPCRWLLTLQPIHRVFLEGRRP